MAARGDTGSFAHDNGRTVMDDLTCPVPWCQSSVCSEAAGFVIAARDEAPAGCANCSQLIDLPDRLRRVLDSHESHLTPGARRLLALRPGGGRAQSILTQLGEGRLVFLEPRTPRPLRSAARARRMPLTPISTPAGPEDKVAWIRLRVVDDQSGEPLPGVLLKVTQPNRKTFDHKTMADGAVEVHGIDPGTCDVASDLKDARLGDTYVFVTLGEQPSPVQVAEKAAETPDAAEGKTTDPPESDARSVSGSAAPISKDGVRIARVEEHKVRTGETIKSLAEQNGLTWQELARFNWDTDIPDEINVKLADEVGCTKKAPDGVNYQFGDSDDPGLLLIPKPWSVQGLATDRTHTIRVKLDTYFRLILENHDQLRIPEAEYEVTLADGSVRKGRLGRGGVGLIKNPPPGEMQIQYPDLDDIEAKSLAAEARKAFDDRNPTEIHRLFRYPPETIRRAFAAYDKHFNDYHGQGLRHDIEQEYMGDPDAELPFYVYLADLDADVGEQPNETTAPQDSSAPDGVAEETANG